MLCDICNKNPATIHIQEIVQGKKKSLHICPDCAAQKVEEDPILKGFNLADMLYNLSDELELPFKTGVKKDKDKEEAVQPTLVCSECGWDTAKFRKTGRLGCAQCYMIFRELLIPGVSTMHKGTLHVGKQPGTPSNSENSRISLKIMNLQQEMNEHVQREEYEKAASIRDDIAQLKKTLSE